MTCIRIRSLNTQIHVSKNYPHIFKFGFKIHNSGKLRSNPKGGRLKDRKQEIFVVFFRIKKAEMIDESTKMYTRLQLTI